MNKLKKSSNPSKIYHFHLFNLYKLSEANAFFNFCIKKYSKNLRTHKNIGNLVITYSVQLIDSSTDATLKSCQKFPLIHSGGSNIEINDRYPNIQNEN